MEPFDELLHTRTAPKKDILIDRPDTAVLNRLQSFVSRVLRNLQSAPEVCLRAGHDDYIRVQSDESLWRDLDELGHVRPHRVAAGCSDDVRLEAASPRDVV